MSESSLRKTVLEASGPKRALVADFVREAILAGRYLAGDRMVERTLCEETGASRSTVREAIRQLENEGFLTNIPNRGSFVATLSAREAAEIYQVRGVLEGLAVRNFIGLATDVQRGALRNSLTELAGAIDAKDVPSQLKAIDNFYEILLSGCCNDTLSDILRLLHGRILRLRATSIRSTGRIRQSLKEMEEIADAIDAHDTDRAWAATVRHMEITSTVALQVIGRTQETNH